jgi:hypothetical protein
MKTLLAVVRRIQAKGAAPLQRVARLHLLHRAGTRDRAGQDKLLGDQPPRAHSREQIEETLIGRLVVEKA